MYISNACHSFVGVAMWLQNTNKTELVVGKLDHILATAFTHASHASVHYVHECTVPLLHAPDFYVLPARNN